MSPPAPHPIPTIHLPVRWLWLICSAFVALCLLNNIVLPLFEASDEAAHFSYANFLARERRLPDLRTDLPSHEVFQPVLYYALLAPVITPFRYSQADLEMVSALNPDWFDTEVNPDFTSIANMQLHTAMERWPWAPVAWAIHVARAVSTVLGVGVLLCVAWIAQMLVDKRARLGSPIYWGAMPILATAVVAFNPKFIHISSVVSNDIAVTFMATLACAWMLRLSPNPARSTGASFAVLGGLIGLAMLCKIQAVGLLAPALLVLLTRVRPTRWPVTGLMFVLGFLLVAGWWLVLNTVQYGDPLAWVQVQRANASLVRYPVLSIIDMAQRIPRLLTSYWGVLGIEKYFPPWVDVVMIVALVLAITGLVRVVGHQIAAASRINLVLQLSEALHSDFAILLAWHAALLILFLSWMRTHVATENSRLLLPGAVSVAILVAVGWLSLVPIRWRVSMAASASIALFALSATTPFMVLQPAFATPKPLTDAELRQQAPAGVDLRINQEIHLWHAELNQRLVTPGANVAARLYWGALDKPIPTSYRVLLEAIGFNGEVIGRKRFIPYNGRHPTTNWAPGQMFADDYLLPIDANAPRGPATINLSIMRPDAAASLLTLGSGAQKLVIGSVKVDAPAPITAPPANVMDARFGSLIRLTGITLNPLPTNEITRTTKLVNTSLSLYFSGLVPPGAAGTGRDEVLFVHLFDKAGNLLSQEDDSPLGDKFSTRWWDTSDAMVETRAVNLTDDVARIVIGFYDPASKVRLPAAHPDGSRWPDDVVEIWRRPGL